MKPTRTFAAALIMSTLLVPLSGCEKQGPAEKAGESIDETTESLGEQVEDAGDAIQDAAEGDK
jgi:hypothetical protein